MRILRIRVEAFGGLRDFDTGDGSLPGFVLVEGDNEAGKSTLFEFLATLLYGFSPANPDGHPYTPWDGSRPEGRGWIRTSDGPVAEVHRRLLSAPSGSLTRDSVVEDLRNRSLPFVEHVPAPVFRQVFALRLSELTGLEGPGWDAVQDRLLGAFGATDIRSAREVADALQSEAESIWRPNRRGRQQIRELEQESSELRMRRTEAMREERRIREAALELERARSQLAQARSDRIAVRAFVERYRALLPIREQLRRIDGLREDAGDPSLLERLPTDPSARLEELRQAVDEIERRIESLESDRIEPTEAIAAWDVHAQTIVAREPELIAFLRRASAAERTRLRKAQLEQECRDLRRRLETGLLNALGRPFDEELAGPLSVIPIGRLRESIQRYERASTPGVEEAILAAGPSILPDERSDRLWAIAGLLGAALLILGIILGRQSLLLALGALFLGMAGARWASDREGRARREQLAAERTADRERAESARRARLTEKATAAQELTTILEPVMDDVDLDRLHPELSNEIARFQEWLRDDWDRREEIERLSLELGRLAADAAGLATLSPNLSSDAEGLVHELPELLRASNARREAAAAAERELARLEERMEKAKAAGAEARERLNSLEQRLTDLGNGDETLGLERATRRIRARDRADQLSEELELLHPDLDEIRARISAAEEEDDDWTVDPDAIAQHRAREEALNEDVERLQGESKALETEIRHLRDRVLVDDLDGELRELAERRERLVRRRDRLWVLGRLLRDAERTLREEHQPALLRQAGHFLSRLTRGRYDRLLLGGVDGRRFHVRGPATPDALEVAPPLSTGTREQIYLALRLAILDHLDRSGERLPLVLDEVLVNWDPARREAGLDLIEEVARERQVFFFTCHRDLADRIAARGAHQIRLREPSGPPPSS